MNSDRPNVLVFMPHDLGDHLGCYGHGTVKSPNIDRLASEGVRFDAYFTASPECTPSRAGMLTGLFTHQSGLMGLCHRGWEFNPGTRHLAGLLADGGYETHLFGLQHETGGAPDVLGYRHAHSQQDKHAGPVCGSVVEFLEGAEAKAGPWFAHVGFFDVHRAWKEESSFDPETIDVPPYLPDNAEVRKDLMHFHQNILEMDEAVGTVLASLRETGLDRDTVVIFTTDHGCPFPRAKSTFYDSGIRIPFLVHRAGRYEGGRVTGELLSNVDFTPTVLELCGCPVPEGLAGRSFRALLDGETYEDRDTIFGTMYYDSCYDPMHYVRTKTHKYIRSFAVTPEDAEGADPEMLAPHKTGTWIRANDNDVGSSYSWKSIADQEHAPPPPEELYDLRTDPLEQKNLVGDPSATAVLEEMRERMHELMVQTSSPLLSGHVSPELSSTRNQRKNQ
ncbi:MAG: sulfatase [bacterium]|nr:sulfatase [bacterium]